MRVGLEVGWGQSESGTQFCRATVATAMWMVDLRKIE